MVCKYVQNEISELKRGQKTVRLCMVVCSINCEVLPYMHHLGKLTVGLLYAASATKQKWAFSQFRSNH